MRQAISVRFAMAFLTLSLILGMSATPAHAVHKVTFVNKTSETVHLAVGTSGPIVIDPVFGSGSGDSWSEGWADIAPGASVTATAPDKGAVVSYYASSDKGKWTGTIKNLVLPFKTFKIKKPYELSDERRAEGYQFRMFRRIEPGQTTVNLTLGAP